MLAEAVSISGGALLVILVALLVAAAAAVAMLVFGCVWARRAGGGDEGAYRRWQVVVTLEALLCLPLLAPLAGDREAGGSLFPAVALALHVTVYLISR